MVFRSDRNLEAIMLLLPGVLFDTNAESNCEVITLPNQSGDFYAYDSDRVECMFNTDQIILIHSNEGEEM